MVQNRKSFSKFTYILIAIWIVTFDLFIDNYYNNTYQLHFDVNVCFTKIKQYDIPLPLFTLFLFATLIIVQKFYISSWVKNT